MVYKKQFFEIFLVCDKCFTTRKKLLFLKDTYDSLEFVCNKSSEWFVSLSNNLLRWSCLYHFSEATCESDVQKKMHKSWWMMIGVNWKISLNYPITNKIVFTENTTNFYYKLKYRWILCLKDVYK